jgi:PncC family amidohydrolase
VALVNEELILKIVRSLEKRAETLCLAESCTGGLLSSQLTALSGVSRIYNGGVVAYANHVKSEILDVPDELLKTFGAVSEQVALKMAEGAAVKLKSTWAISITGIAGPSGGSPAKPVGTVCFAVVGPGVAQASSAFFEGNRTEIQEKSAQFALNLLWRQLDQN